MAGSYEQINYSLRPAKSIERKMIGEALRRLASFGDLSSYRYIGFGSTFFSDFLLFHKILGIDRMISIEQDTENRERFEFNRPFRCVEIKFGTSSEVLPTLPWKARTILWLDYDGRLDSGVLGDVQQFCNNAASGSVVLVTVNAEAGVPDGQRLQRLKDAVTEAKIPGDIQEKDLAGWGTADACRRIVDNEIKEVLNTRNGVLDPENQFAYRQLFNFQYADSSRMLTVGGILYDEGQSGMFGSCSFDKLAFVKSGVEPCKIEVPSLTYREIRHLDSLLPGELPEIVKKSKKIPEKDVERYSRVYRYFPSFVEAEL